MDNAGQIVEASTERMLVEAANRIASSAYLEKLGIYIARYGLVVTLLLIGILKFTGAEAQGIQPLVADNPLMFWLYHIFSLQVVSNLIGATEIVVAVLVALRPVSARLSFAGSLGVSGPLFLYHPESESSAVLVLVNSRLAANSQAISCGVLSPSAL